MNTELIRGDLTDERARRYAVIVDGTCVMEKQFEYPVAVYHAPGHSFHRVIAKDGWAYLMPAPGPIVRDGKVIGFCEVSWAPVNPDNPCQ